MLMLWFSSVLFYETHKTIVNKKCTTEFYFHVLHAISVILIANGEMRGRKGGGERGRGTKKNGWKHEFYDSPLFAGLFYRLFSFFTIKMGFAFFFLRLFVI